MAQRVAKPCVRIWRQRPTLRIRAQQRIRMSLRRQFDVEKGAELRRFLTNKNRDLSLRMCVEERA